MSNTRLFRLATVGPVVSGLFLALWSGNAFQAQLSGGGAVALRQPLPDAEPMLRAAAGLSPIQANPDAGMQLLVGILLVMVGLLVHALYLARLEREAEEREVPVRAAHKPWSPKWFWMKIHLK